MNSLCCIQILLWLQSREYFSRIQMNLKLVQNSFLWVGTHRNGQMPTGWFSITFLRSVWFVNLIIHLLMRSNTLNLLEDEDEAWLWCFRLSSDRRICKMSRIVELQMVKFNESMQYSIATRINISMVITAILLTIIEFILFR